MDRASRIESSGSWTVSGAASRGREKGVWGVERACHTGQHRSLQSVCVTQEIGADLGSRVLSRCAAASCVRVRFPPAPPRRKWPSTRGFAGREVIRAVHDLRGHNPADLGFRRSRCWGECSGDAPPYYASLLAHAGCTTDAHMHAHVFGGSMTENFNPLMYGSCREVITGLLRSLPDPGISGSTRAAQVARRLSTHDQAFAPVLAAAVRLRGCSPIRRALPGRWPRCSSTCSSAGTARARSTGPVGRASPCRCGSSTSPSTPRSSDTSVAAFAASLVGERYWPSHAFRER